jgi:hypothetical protein
LIDVSDLYDACPGIAASIWRVFGASVDDESWDDIIDSLEHDLFLAGCAHRIGTETQEELDPDEVPARIRLYNGENEVPGAAGEYVSHAFYPDPESGDVPNAVMTGNLMSSSRPGVRLVLGGRGGRPANRRPQLPQVS